MELRHLFTFKEIAERNSFTKAAMKLGYSQPTVTSHIQALERDLNVKLFDRIGKKIVITGAGAQLLTYVSQLTDLCKQIETLANDQDPIKGELRIGAPETLTIYRLEPILQEYRHRFPQVDIKLINDANAPLYEKLKNGEIDIAFQIAAEQEYNHYVTLHLAHESFVLAAHAASNIENLAVCPEQLANETVIYNAKGCIYRTVFEEYLKTKQIAPRNFIELWSIEAIKWGVIRGLGISMLPLITVKKDLEEGRLQSIDLPLKLNHITTQLIYHKDKWLSKALCAWIDITQEHAKNWE